MYKIIAISFVLIFISLSDQFAADATVKDGGARVYADADNSSLILDVVAGGVMVTVNETSGDWTRITMPSNAETGWVESRHLEKNASQMEFRPPLASSYASDANLNREQVDRLRDRVSGISGTLNRLDRRIDKIISPESTMSQQENEDMKPEVSLNGERVSEMPQDKWPAEKWQHESGQNNMPVETMPDNFYRWSNRFVMGRNFDKGEQCYGIGISRRMDQRGIMELDFESTYAFGAQDGAGDDYLDWSLGARFNFRPDIYRIYPFIGIVGGMRHYIDSDITDTDNLLWGGLLGLTADVNDVFSLTAETRAYAVQADSGRQDEGRVAFFASYRW